MALYEMTLGEHWLVVRRRWRTIIASTVIVILLGWWVAGQTPTVYEATAAVQFEQSARLSGLLMPVVWVSSPGLIETQAALIRSYPVLDVVARRQGSAPGAGDDKAQAAARDALATRIRTARVPGTNIIEITANGADPRSARDLANAVAEAYRDYNRTLRNARVEEARKFIERQLRDAEERIRLAEAEDLAFRSAHGLLAHTGENPSWSLFRQLKGDLERTLQQRTEFELARADLDRADLGKTRIRFFVESSNPVLERLRALHAELLVERNNLALEFTTRHPRLLATEERLREVRGEIRRELDAQIRHLQRRESIVNRQLASLLQRTNGIEAELQRRQRETKINDALLTVLKTKHEEALIREAEVAEEVSIVRPAAEPGRPQGRHYLATLTAGALLGLVIGLVLAYIEESRDTSIRTIEDVEQSLQLAVIGIVPHIDVRQEMARVVQRHPMLVAEDAETRHFRALLVALLHSRSPVGEAYRTLRTNLQLLSVDGLARVLLVTSATLQEGKTTTLANLALTLARNGLRVLVVDANLRRPTLARYFGRSEGPGLADVLAGRSRWRDCLRTVDGTLWECDEDGLGGLDHLQIIDSGGIPPNPSELLSAPAMARFLDEVRTEFDMVLLDTPPMLPVADAAIVAGRADGVLLVHQAGKIGRQLLKRPKAQLASARAKVIGVVLNDVRPEVVRSVYDVHYTAGDGVEALPRGRRGRRLEVMAAGSKSKRPWPSYTDLWSGMALLTGLTATLIGVIAWRMGWLGY
jgi:succinoglycan biosynthesis transport protein ExoP